LTDIGQTGRNAAPIPLFAAIIARRQRPDERMPS
jgi:hypothetical protein